MKEFKNQTELFEWIWDNRPHVSEVSGKQLFPKGHWQFHWQFCHILPKGSYPSLKLDPENIMLMLPHEHSYQERFEVFRQRKEELKQKYYQQNKVKKL